MAGMCPSPSTTGSKVHLSESTGDTDTIQVEDDKTEHAVHQRSTAEDAEEGKRGGCS